jgi:hypothetical protein
MAMAERALPAFCRHFAGVLTASTRRAAPRSIYPSHLGLAAAACSVTLMPGYSAADAFASSQPCAASLGASAVVRLALNAWPHGRTATAAQRIQLTGCRVPALSQLAFCLHSAAAACACLHEAGEGKKFRVWV